MNIPPTQLKIQHIFYMTAPWFIMAHELLVNLRPWNSKPLWVNWGVRSSLNVVCGIWCLMGTFWIEVQWVCMNMAWDMQSCTLSLLIFAVTRSIISLTTQQFVANTFNYRKRNCFVFCPFYIGLIDLQWILLVTAIKMKTVSTHQLDLLI